MLALSRDTWLYPELLSDDFRDNPHLMSQLPYLLHVASQRLLDSKQFAVLALANYDKHRYTYERHTGSLPCAIYQNFSQSVRSDREVVVLAVSNEDYRILESAPTSVLDDRELVMALVLFEPSALKYASCRLRHDASLMMLCMCLRDLEKQTCYCKDFIIMDDLRRCVEELKTSNLRCSIKNIRGLAQQRLSKLERICAQQK
jgi:hypothetical protein